MPATICRPFYFGSGIRESNPPPRLGKPVHYRCANSADPEFQSLRSRYPDSNRGPTHYECVALPTEPYRQTLLPYCTPAGARTLDTLIKSQVLYQLSYGCLIFNVKQSFQKERRTASSLFCTPAGARTLDTLIKSQVLYQLSYGCILFF